MSRDQRGSVTPLVIGFAVVLALLVAAVVDASAAFLQRQRLDSVADAAALAATDGLQGEAVYTQGLGARAQIDPRAAAGYVTAYVANTRAAVRFPGLRYDVSARGDTVVVHVSAPLRLPLRVPGVTMQPLVSGTAASVIVVGR